MDAQRLGEQGQNGHEGKHQHGTHASGIGVHAAFLNEELRQVAAADGENRYDEVEHEYQSLPHGGIARVAELVGEIGGSPEEEEPPYAVGQSLAGHECPRLAECEAAPERNCLCLLGLDFSLRLVGLVLTDVGKLGGVDVFRFLGERIASAPETHPHEAERADNHEGHLPAELLGQHGDAQRGGQRAHRGSGIEYRGSESAVHLGEVLGRHLDGGGEVARLADGEQGAAAEEEPDAHRSYRERQSRARLDGAKSLDRGYPFIFHCHPATTGMHHGGQRPDEYGPEVAFARAHPVDELAGHEAHGGIEEREESGDVAVVGVGPVEFRRYEILPGKREHLAVEIVDCCCEE